jgi:hypothetical protein
MTMNDFFKQGIVPIVQNNNHISGILSEFNAIKAE